MNGSEPPISRTTFFRFRPATSATAAPARSEPVTETPRTRGSGITFSAICSWVARIVWYAPSGRPTSLYIFWIASADSGQRPHRRAADHRRALAREQLDRLVLEEVRRAVGVVRVDLAAEVDLAEG